MIKVLFLIGTLNGGGAERILTETVNSLDSSKYQITVQTIFDEGLYREKLSPVIRYRSIIFLKKGFIRSLFFKLLFKLCGCAFVYKFFVDDDYDYEISFLEGLSTKIISKSANKKSKKYTWLHTDINCCPNSYIHFGSEKKEEEAYKKFDKVFCVSESVRESLLKKYSSLDEKKIKVLYNIIDDKSITDLANVKAELPAQIRPFFIAVGRLVKVKGYERLLEVHSRLIKDGFKHSLLILGDGEEYDSLLAYIENNNLKNTAFLLGFQENPYKYISKADLFICSSFAEGYSTVVSEAVLCGIPVLSTDVAGAKEPSDCPRCSIVVENDKESMYLALKELLTNQEKLLGLRNDMKKRKVGLEKKYLVKKFEEHVFGDWQR